MGVNRLNQKMNIMRIKILGPLIFVTLSFSAKAQNGYSLQKIKLPSTAEAKDVYVKTSGNYYIMNDDIIVGKKLQNISLIRTAEAGWSYIWPKGYIPVALEDSISLMGFETEILRALDYLNANTRLRFKPRTTEKDFIFINYQTVAEMGFMGGNSWVGRQGGSQDFNISTTNFRTIVHELLHAVGFWHEQSRHDRDLYINILWDNIRDSAKHNYQIEPGLAQGDYDYMSIMHYWNGAFSKNGNNTMQCRFGNFISDCTMGGSLPSVKDLLAINSTYWFNEGVAVIDFGKEFTTMRESAQLRDLTNSGSVKVSSAVIEAKRQPVPDGMYKIKINQTGKYLAIEGISKDNGARLVQWDYVEQDNHKFYVKDIGNGYYVISAVHSNRYLNAAGQSKNDGTPIIQWDYAEQDNVKWRIYYSNQLDKPGWVLENKNASPIRLSSDNNAGNNGEPFILMLPKRLDANDYEPVQTFTFEKIGNLPLSEKTPIHFNNVQKIKQN